MENQLILKKIEDLIEELCALSDDGLAAEYKGTIVLLIKRLNVNETVNMRSIMIIEEFVEKMNAYSPVTSTFADRYFMLTDLKLLKKALK